MFLLYCRIMVMTHWDIHPDDIWIDKTMILGTGRYCTVYLGKWRSTTVAIKKINAGCPIEDHVFLQQELSIMSRLHHPNVLQLFGFCRQPLMMIIEYMEGLDLSNNLCDISVYPSFMSFSLRKSWSIQLCHAVEYLHSHEPRYVIHRDLKPHNILINRCKLKIADFGLAKCCRAAQRLQNLRYNYTTEIGTPYYMAPEMWFGQTYNQHVDTWAVGIILYEIWELKTLFSRIPCSLSDFYEKWKPIFRKTPRKLRPIISRCLDFNPDKRPPIRHVLRKIDDLRLIDTLWW